MLLVLASSACSIRIREPELHEPAAPLARSEARPELKVHLKSGELLVLDEWIVTPGRDRLSGNGRAYTATREPKGPTARQDVALDDVALLETNAPDSVTSVGLGALAVTTTVIGTLTGYCVVNPKGCFGSCPTFYVEGADGREPDRPQAEGFSGSIARALEADDLDALRLARPGGSTVAVTMRNEALETHAVRHVRLLAVPRSPEGRVLAGIDDRFYPASTLARPLACLAPEGDCLSPLGTGLGTDRVSTADAMDLATRESVELVFPPARGPLGLAIGARQTLLSTFLFYQTMAHVGRGAGEFLAAIERGGPEAGRRAMGMARVLGGIDVEVAQGDGPWRSIGSFDEPGPIAGDLRVLPFEGSGVGPLRVRLRLARGHWRLGPVTLERLGAPTDAARLEPVCVERDGRRDAAAEARLGSGRYLVTHPRDAYRLRFRLPPSAAPLELFLESRGYYYEWMRADWLVEEDPGLVALALGDPAQALRQLAPAYKEQEPELERAFWASRFRK